MLYEMSHVSLTIHAKQKISENKLLIKNKKNNKCNKTELKENVIPCQRVVPVPACQSQTYRGIILSIIQYRTSLVSVFKVVILGAMTL